MEWTTVTAIFGGLMMVLTFLWGVIKTFKKPDPIQIDPSSDALSEWKTPLKELKKDLEKKWGDISVTLTELRNKINSLENAETYDKKDLDDLKERVKSLEEKFEKKMDILSGKQDKMLERFIEFLQQQ